MGYEETNSQCLLHNLPRSLLIFMRWTRYQDELIAVVAANVGYLLTFISDVIFYKLCFFRKIIFNLKRQYLIL